MRRTLIPYPGSSCDAIEGITVEVTRPTPSSLSLHYEVVGNISKLVVPAWTSRSRADELWRTTCFEAFVSGSNTPVYYEFNLSPSSQWAAYRFNGYRDGMTPQEGVELDGVTPSASSWRMSLFAVLHLDRLDLAATPWRLAISAVMEETSGPMSYWALAHPSDKPDFHHPDSFVLELP